MIAAKRKIKVLFLLLQDQKKKKNQTMKKKNHQMNWTVVSVVETHD